MTSEICCSPPRLRSTVSVIDLNPGSRAVSSYLAGGMLRSRKRPPASVTAGYDAPAVLVTVTCTPGNTAPLASRSAPDSDAGACAAGGAAAAIGAAARGTARRSRTGTTGAAGVGAGAGADSATSRATSGTSIIDGTGSVSVTATTGAATGLVALVAQPAARHPDQRVEPVAGADYLGRNLQRPVAARNVRELVREDGLDPGSGPQRRAGRHDDSRSEEAPRQQRRASVALEDGHWPQCQLCREGGRLFAPQARLNRPTAAVHHDEPAESREEACHDDQEADRPDPEQHFRPRHHRRVGEFGDADAGARNGRITAQRQSRTGCLRRFRQQRNLPSGKDRLQQRNGGGRGKRRRENDVPQRGGPLIQQPADQQRECADDAGVDDDGNGGGHSPPSFRALAIILAIRSSCSSVNRAPSPPSSAATACSDDPSKNVSTRCRSADLRAACRASTGIYTKRTPSSS